MNYPSPKRLLLILVLLTTLLINCSFGISENAKSDKLQIVTSFAPLYSFAANIVGDRAELYNLVPPGISIHNYEPKPSDIKKITEADLLIINGLGLEVFLSDIVDAASNEDLILIDSSKNIKPYITGGSSDPHIWLSIDKAIEIVEVLTEAISLADPENAEFYNLNARSYIAQLIDFKSMALDQLAVVKKQKFIVFHDAYQYFLSEFDLVDYQIASIEEFPGKEPSQAYIEKLIALIDSDEVSVVFTEPQFSPKIIEVLKSEFDIQTYELDPIGINISSKSYLSNMNLLLDTFLSAFK